MHLLCTFAVICKSKVLGNIDKELTDRLEDCLLSPVYWRTRFDEFNLSLDHLERSTISRSETDNKFKWYLINGSVRTR